MSATFTQPPIVTNNTAVSDDEPLYEIVDGQRVELPPKSVYATLVATNLLGGLAFFSRAHPIGRPLCEMLFRLP